MLARARISPNGTRLEGFQREVRRYLPALIFALLGAIAVVLTQLKWPNAAIAQAYGANLAASFLELVIGAGLLQWFLERQRKPMVLYAHRRVRSLLGTLVGVMQDMVDEAPGPATKPATFADLASRWNAGFADIDFPSAAKRGEEGFRSLLERIRDDVDRARQQYAEAAGMIGTYCDPKLVVALEELIHGDDHRRMWAALQRDLIAHPTTGWITAGDPVGAFSTAIANCLIAYDDARTEEPLVDMPLGLRRQALIDSGSTSARS